MAALVATGSLILIADDSGIPMFNHIMSRVNSCLDEIR